MANTTADKLALLQATKADLKAALAEKGQTVGDVFSTYPAAVRAIETGGETATLEVGTLTVDTTFFSAVTVDGFTKIPTSGTYIVPVPCLVSYFNSYDNSSFPISGLIEKTVDEYVPGTFSDGAYRVFFITGDCKIGR